MVDTIAQWLMAEGLAENVAGTIGWLAVAVAILILAWLSNVIAKQILLRIVAFFIRRSKTRWDDALQNRMVFVRFSHLAPILVIYFGAAALPSIQDMLERVSIAYMYFMGMLILYAFLNAANDIYEEYDVSREKPIKGYIQIVQIITMLFIAILIFARLIGRSPVALLTGLGAMTAILILVFKDTILGLVASLQLSFNDMVRRGDWIEMQKFGADGDVIDVSLHTIKVQNWDKTITSIPSYALISDSFKNWRGMSESGGRRIKRSINIDMNSIKFCTADMIARFKKIQHITEYIEKKTDEIEQHNEQTRADTTTLVNGRHLTNIGTFRAYIVAYLKNHPKIHQGMTFLVRQLQPTEHGLPIEIYVFSNDQAWANYEAIQADIFDHILAVVPEFDLRVYQSPTGSDFTALAETRADGHA